MLERRTRVSIRGRALASFLACALAGAGALGCSGCRRSSSSSSSTSSSSSAPAEAGGGGADGSDGRGATLLGGERGLDHVGVGVKDLHAATHTYHEVLGFSRPTEGTLPNGIKNVNYYFADATYLETMVYWDRTKAAWLASFTDKHAGAVFVVLSAYSPDATRAFLSARGVTLGNVYSGTIQTGGEDAMPEEKWKTFFLPEGQLPGNPLYFISYARGPREDFLRKLGHHNVRKVFSHENTALGLRATWIAVADLEAASRAYASIGLERGKAFVDPKLDADGQVFEAGLGQIWLFSPRGTMGSVAAFLRERGGSGIMGVTLAAGSVQTAAKLIAERTGASMPTYDGVLGTSIRVSPELAEGVWIEFAQHSPRL